MYRLSLTTRLASLQHSCLFLCSKSSPRTIHLRQTLFRPHHCPQTGPSRSHSTLVGKQGRIYLKIKTLHSPNDDPNDDLWLLSSDNEYFVSKPVPSPFIDRVKEIKRGVAGAKYLRTHIEETRDGQCLILKYYRDTLLDLASNDLRTHLPLAERKTLFRQVACGVQELHSKGWMHLDIKSDNVFVDWDQDESTGLLKVKHAVLGDLESALPQPGPSAVVDGNIGNIMWRSPEAQLGRGITELSDIFSLGLVGFTIMTDCIFFSSQSDFELMAARGLNPGLQILKNMVWRFGPPPSEPSMYIRDPDVLSYLAKQWSKLPGLGDDAPTHFTQLETTQYPGLDRGLRSLLARMLTIDPADRLTAEQVLQDPWWEQGTGGNDSSG